MALDQIVDIITENWLTLVIGVGSSAFGAWGAQWAISSNQKRENAVQKINVTNASLSICFAICNRYMALKKQHVKPLFQKYKEEKIRYEWVILNPHHINVYNFNMDFETFDVYLPPVHILERYIFEAISPRARTLVVGIALFEAIDQLNALIVRRNDLIDEMRAAPRIPDKEFARLYFAARRSDGSVDSRFRDIITGIYDATDSCIYFSKQLSDELYLYGRRVESAYPSVRLPKLVALDWNRAVKNGLMPTREQFADWEAGFSPPLPNLIKRFVLWIWPKAQQNSR